MYSGQAAASASGLHRGDSYSGDVQAGQERVVGARYRDLTVTVICREMLLLLSRDRPELSGGELEESMVNAWVENGDLGRSLDDFSGRVLAPVVEKINDHIRRHGGTGALGRGDFLRLPEMENTVEMLRGVNLRAILYPGMGTHSNEKIFLRFDFAYEKGPEVD
jgi:hypothetical protein